MDSLLKATVNALRSSKDKASCVEGLKQMQSWCTETDSITVVLDFLGGASGAKDLLELWDNLFDVKDSAVTAELYLLARGILNLKGTAPVNQHEHKVEIERGIDHLVIDILGHRLKGIFTSLQSESHGRVNAAFSLLGSIARTSPGACKGIIDGFDASPSKVDFWQLCKNKSDDSGNWYRKLIGGYPISMTDICKSQHRDCFLDMGVSLLQNCDSVDLIRLLSMKGIVSVLFLKLSMDHQEIVRDVLAILKDRIVSEQANVSRYTKSEFFTEGTLCQLAHICGKEGSEENVVKARDLLIELCTDPTHGIIPHKTRPVGPPTGSYSRVMGMMWYLQPTHRKHHCVLLVEICKACPRLAAEYLGSGKIPFNPHQQEDFITGVGVMNEIIRAAEPCRMEMVEGVAHGRGHPRDVDAFVQRLIRWTIPREIDKGFLNKSFMSANTLVAFTALSFLRCMMNGLKGVMTSTRIEGWEPVHREIVARLKKLLPHPHVAIRMYSESVGCIVRGTGSGSRSSEHQPRDIQHEAKNVLLLTSVTNVLELYWRLTPELMAESGMDVTKMLARDLSLADGGYQLAVVQTVQTATEHNHRESVRSWLGHRLAPTLRLLTETKSKEVYSATEGMLRGWLGKLDLFGDGGVELMPWISLIPAPGTNALDFTRHNVVLDFLASVVTRLAQTPQVVHEMKAEYLDRNRQQVDAPDPSALCVSALYHCLQIVFSRNRSDHEKIWVASYTASVLSISFMQSSSPVPFALVLRNMLMSATQRLSRQHSRDSTGDSMPVRSDKVVLPDEGYALQSLWTLCHNSFSEMSERNPQILDSHINPWLGDLGGSLQLPEAVTFVKSKLMSLEFAPPALESEQILETMEEWRNCMTDRHAIELDVLPTVNLTYLDQDAVNPLCHRTYFSMILLKVPGKSALEYIAKTVQEKAWFLEQEDFVAGCAEVLQGHCMNKSMMGYLMHALDVDHLKQMSWGCPLFPVLLAMLEFAGVRDDSRLWKWCCETMKELPEYWRTVTAQFVIGCLARCDLSDDALLERAVSLIEEVSIGDLPSEQSLEILKSVLSHPVLTALLNHHGQPAVQHRITNLLLKVFTVLGDDPAKLSVIVDHASQLLDCIIQKTKLEIERGEYSGNGMQSLSALAKYVNERQRAILRNTLEDAGRTRVQELQGKRGFSLPKDLTTRLVPFLRLYDETGVKIDWNAFRWVWDNGRSDRCDSVLLDAIHSGASHTFSSFQKRHSLVSLFDCCLAQPSLPRGEIVAEMVKIEPGCQCYFAKHLDQIAGNAGLFLAMLPAIFTHVMHSLEDGFADDKLVVTCLDKLLGELTGRMRIKGGNAADCSAGSLEEYGLPVLLRCLALHHLSEEQWSHVLDLVIPAKGWALDEESDVTFGTVTTKISVAAFLLQKRPKRMQVGTFLKGLSRFVVGCCWTLSSCARRLAKYGQEARVEKIAALLYGHLDGFVGDLLAAVDNHLRGTEPFCKICEAAQKLALSVLKYNMVIPDKVRLIRRFFAALVPEPEEDSFEMDRTDSGNLQKSVCMSKPGVFNHTAVTVSTTVLDALLSHSKFLDCMQPSDVDQTDPSLPESVRALVTPLGSLLGLVDLNPEIDSGKGEKSETGSIRLEVTLLIETLLEMQAGFGMEIRVDQSEAAREAKLLVLLLTGYNASLAPEDVSVLHVLNILEKRIKQRLPEIFCTQNGAVSTEWELLTGPLARLMYVWGKTAASAHMQGCVVPQISTFAASDYAAELGRILHKEPLIDARRCALGVVNFPESRSLEATEGAEDISVSSGARGGYDPAYLLPFCVITLEKGVISVREFWRLGLLAFCIRAMASAHSDMRRLASQALHLFGTKLQSCKLQGKVEIQTLVDITLAAVGEDSVRIPTASALFACEASMQLTNDKNEMYGAIRHYIMHTPVLSLTEVPLCQDILSHNVQSSGEAEQWWMIRMIAAGISVDNYCGVYQRRRTIPLLMGFGESQLAAVPLQNMVVEVIRRVIKIHTLATSLVENSALISWLGERAVHFGWHSRSPSSSKSLKPGTPPSTLSKHHFPPNHPQAISTIRALQQLLHNGIGVDKKPVFTEYIHVGWLLCKMVINYYEDEVDVGISQHIHTDRKKRWWPEKKGAFVAEMWYEVVVYMRSLIRICSVAMSDSKAHVLKWKGMWGLLRGKEVLSAWLPKPKLDIDLELLDIVLLMVSPKPQGLVHEELPYWRACADWASQVVTVKENGRESMNWSGVESWQRLRNDSDKGTLSRSAKLLLWLGSFLLQGVSPFTALPSVQQCVAKMEEVVWLHGNLSGQEKRSTIWAVLACILHVGEPIIESIKAGMETGQQQKNAVHVLIRKTLPELMDSVKISPDTLVAKWHDGIVHGKCDKAEHARSITREETKIVYTLITLIRELVIGCDTFELTQLMLSEI